MENENSKFKSVGELLPDALNRLYQRVKDRKLKEMIEKFKEEKEYLVFHSLYGRRVNDALARAYAFAAARLRYRDVEISKSRD